MSDSLIRRPSFDRIHEDRSARVGLVDAELRHRTLGWGHRVRVRTSSLARDERVRTHLMLAVAAAVVLVLEGLRGSATLNTSAAWPIAQGVVAGVALLGAWRRRESLRLLPVLALGCAFQLAWVGLHLALGVAGDYDPNDVYRLQGKALLHGDYPHSEYPPGAVGLFALETWLGGGHARTTNALLMVPFQLVVVAAVWQLRTRWSPWLATCLALWPLNAFYWEFRFDLVPTAALVVGLLFALRERWYLAGFALGVGAIVKWTPGLAAAALLLWLLRMRLFRAAGVYVVAFVIPVLVANLPVLIWRKSELVAAYTTQSARTVTAESFVYLPLRLFWHARPGYWYFGAADAPAEANRAVIWFQIAVVVLVIVAVVFTATRSSAVALAGLAPAVFFLTNRIFSPQFFVLVLAATAVATALVATRRREVLAIASCCAVATTADTVLFQSMLGGRPVGTTPNWTFVSAVAFVPIVAVTAWLILRSLSARGVEGPPIAVVPGSGADLAVS
jgi:hypothetical protein